MTLLYLRNEKSKRDRKFVIDILSGKNGNIACKNPDENDSSKQNTETGETDIFIFLNDLSLEMEEYIINSIDSSKKSGVN